MNTKIAVWSAVVCTFLFLSVSGAKAEQHRATHLGNPATRFAKPLNTPEDLRAMLRSEPLRKDVELVLRESGFTGDVNDLLQAAATVEIHPLQVPPGTHLAAMSTREHGKPKVLHNVLWAGKEPFDAYEFFFVSKDHNYRLVVPKACANFWVEDQGKVPHPALSLDCDAPDKVLTHRKAQVCVTLKNTGDGVEPLTVVTMPSPAGANLTAMTDGGQIVNNSLVWSVTNLPPGRSVKFCGAFNQANPGILPFSTTAEGSVSGKVESHCETQVIGVAGVLFELVDVDDPIEVGSNETYTVTVLNQGFAPITNVRLTCTIPDGQEFVSGMGSSPVSASGTTVTMDNLSSLRPKDTARWEVVVKATAAGDMRFMTILNCDQVTSALQRSESTHQY